MVQCHATVLRSFILPNSDFRFCGSFASYPLLISQISSGLYRTNLPAHVPLLSFTIAENKNSETLRADLEAQEATALLRAAILP